MIRRAFQQTLPKPVEAAIMKLGKEYERYPSPEELSAEANISILDAESYLKLFGKRMTKMR